MNLGFGSLKILQPLCQEILREFQGHLDHLGSSGAFSMRPAAGIRGEHLFHNFSQSLGKAMDDFFAHGIRIE